MKIRSSSKNKSSKNNKLTKCMEKVIDRYPDATCEIVTNMTSCIQMCEKIGKSKDISIKLKFHNMWIKWINSNQYSTLFNFPILGIEKCRSNGGSIRKINCKRKKKSQTNDYSDKIDNGANNEMTCCCNVKCDPIEKPARQLLEEYGNVWWPNFSYSKHF